MQGTEIKFKCDFFNEISADKSKLRDQIKNTHKKCKLCTKIFVSTEFLETLGGKAHKKS